MVILFQHTDAAENLWRAAQKNLREYVAAARAAGEESGDTDALAVADALADAGKIVAGRIPAAPVRHNRTISGKVRRMSEEIHGTDPGAFCPLLLAEGVSATDGAGMAQGNGEERGAEMRRTSHRCPVCLAPDVALTAPKARRDNPENRWHA